MRDSRDLEEAAVRAIVAEMDGRGTLATSTPEEKRKSARAVVGRAGEPQSVAEVSNLEVSGRSGPIPVRVYQPAGITRGSAPLGLYLHGGGFISGDLDTHDALCRALANAGPAVIMAVDYRLAPEFPYPAALDDAFDSLLWAEAHAQEFGADERRMAVLGDSAGGNLAAVLARRASQTSGVRLAGQVLIYPVLDAALQSHSLVRNALVPPFTLLDCVAMWQWYLPAGQAREHPDVSPLWASDLGGLPPALVITAGLDVLCDEGAAYAEKLRQSGNAVRHLHHPDMPHGFIQWAGTVEAARKTIVHIGHFLREM